MPEDQHQEPQPQSLHAHSPEHEHVSAQWPGAQLPQQH